MTLHLEDRIIWSDYRLKEGGHAGLFLKFDDNFLIVVGTRPYFVTSALTLLIIDASMIEPPILRKGSLSRL